MEKKLFALLMVWCSLSGCAHLTQMQDTINKFDQGVHSISASQIAYLNGAHMIECERQFYSNALLTALGQRNIDLRESCIVDDAFYLTSRQIETRKLLFDALTLYVDKLQAISSSEEVNNLDSGMQAQAKGINRVATSFGLSAKDATIANYVEAAVAGLTEMALENKMTSTIKEAAKSQSDNLSKVVNAIKTENIFIADGLYGDIGDIRSKLTAVVSAIRDKQGPAAFSDIINSRTYLRSLNVFGPGAPELSDNTTTDAGVKSADPKNPTLNPFSTVQQLNNALDAIVAANNALAEEGESKDHKANFLTIVSNLTALAKNVEAFQTALSK